MFKTRAPDAEWMDRLRARGFTADSNKAPHLYPTELLTLKEKLLSFGGYGVILAHNEPDLDQIMSRGYIEKGCNPIMLSGQRGACHRNAFRFWKTNPDNIILCTGWALNDDGCWRQHSWAKLRGKIVETTTPCVAYFGFDLTADEAIAFGDGN